MAQEIMIEQSRLSYVDLPAIIGGALFALAFGLVMANFASAIGLSFADDTRWTGENAWTYEEARAAVIAGSLWIVWTQITASMAGGYIAGRMRRPVAGATNHEREIRDGAHGLLVWSAATVAVAVALGIATAFAHLAEVPAADLNREMTDGEHNAAIILAFVTASSSLVAAVASWWAATLGGDHRDNDVDHSRYVSFRKG